jgi:hypothetical protein
VLITGQRNDNDLWGLIGVGVLMVVSIAQYFTYRYRVDADGVVIRSGLFQRSVRHIPFARIQNVSLHQSCCIACSAWPKSGWNRPARPSPRARCGCCGSMPRTNSNGQVRQVGAARQARRRRHRQRTGARAPARAVHRRGDPARPDQQPRHAGVGGFLPCSRKPATT